MTATSVSGPTMDVLLNKTAPANWIPPPSLHHRNKQGLGPCRSHELLTYTDKLGIGDTDKFDKQYAFFSIYVP